jgi:hypothetical protein
MRSGIKLAEIGQIPLTDDEYLEESIINVYRLKSDEICSIKDTKSTYMAITPVFARMLGFASIDKVIGTIGDVGKGQGLPSQIEAVVEVFYKQDREVEQAREMKQQINILEYTTGLEILKCTKKPIINPATGNILGTFALNNKFILSNTLKTIINIHDNRFSSQSSMDIIETAKEFDLAKKELEVLYCVCLGLSDRKSIARFLSFIHKKDINPDTTVKDAFSRLYEKLPCHSISMLAEYAISKGLHLRIPKSFIREGSFELIQETPIIG